jgi:O-acetyl-ADP-ribose deacetylase (regulator of RNase III)
MIEFHTGDILQADAEALVNTVNCVGFMGRGIALAFKEAYPENFKAYERACRHDEVVPGSMFIFDTHRLTNPRWIINFPTKRHWRGKSRLEDIRSGLEDLVRIVRDLGIQSVAIPPLGCGLGGLDWRVVKPVISESVAQLKGVDIMVYEPGGTSSESGQRRPNPPSMTRARALLILAMRRYLRAMLDPSVTLLELHKLMYFIQSAGEPLQLNYQHGHYGPYAENLRFLLQNMNHYYVESDMTQGDRPDVPVQLVPSAVGDAEAFVSSTRATVALDRVFQLIEGWESPYGLELLATVHWLAVEDNVSGREAIVQATYRWNARKMVFTARQIGMAYDVLRDHNWITA